MNFILYLYILTGIKKYIVNVIIKLSSTPESLEQNKVYLNKLNMILVQVIILSQFFLFMIFIEI